MKTPKTYLLLLLTVLFINCTWAQETSSTEEQGSTLDIAIAYYEQIIVTAAVQIPEEYYSFRPTPEVRSLGELLAHIAISNFEMVAIAKDESDPVLEITLTKPEIIKALKKSFEYLLEARKNMTKAEKEKLVQFMGLMQPAGGVLDSSVLHSLIHYGNVIVYMRLKGLVPPSWEDVELENDSYSLKKKSKEKQIRRITTFP